MRIRLELWLISATIILLYALFYDFIVAYSHLNGTNLIFATVFTAAMIIFTVIPLDWISHKLAPN